MKYAGKEVRAAIIEELSDIVIDGVTIPVYNYPQGAKPPMILVTNQIQYQSETKDDICAYGSLLVRCVTAYDMGEAGEVMADAMASAVSEKLTNQVYMTDNFITDIMYIESNEGTSNLNQTEIVIIRQLQLRLFIQQL